MTRTYPHGIAINTVLSNARGNRIQLLLHVSPRAPRIFQIKIRIVQELQQPLVFVAQGLFDALAVYQ